jgi:hypothetical protein
MAGAFEERSGSTGTQWRSIMCYPLRDICNRLIEAGPKGFMRRIASFVAILFLLTGSTTSVAWACACGCSVFDVGGLAAPQEDDRGGTHLHRMVVCEPKSELDRLIQGSRQRE